METEWTQQYVRGELEKMGYAPKKCGKAGLTVLVGKPGGKVFLIRADMDALPLTEASGEPFSSENPGKMHACGHDMHTAMLLGTAKLLKEHEDLLEGQVKLMFQSGEETGEGCRDMVETGVLEDPKVDAAQMLHVAAGACNDPTGRHWSFRQRKIHDHRHWQGRARRGSRSLCGPNHRYLPHSHRPGGDILQRTWPERVSGDHRGPDQSRGSTEHHPQHGRNVWDYPHNEP